MPTTYTARGNAIEKNGPHEGGLSGRGHCIAFCEDDRTAELLVKAIDLLADISASDLRYYDLPPTRNINEILNALGML
jgi:hypothetical protein